jgi:hypothetical protein
MGWANLPNFLQHIRLFAVVYVVRGSHAALPNFMAFIMNHASSIQQKRQSCPNGLSCWTAETALDCSKLDCNLWACFPASVKLHRNAPQLEQNKALPIGSTKQQPADISCSGTASG